MNQKWYNKDWFLWVCLILFAPVGIYLLWKNKRFSKNATIAMTAIFSIWFIVAIANGSKPKEQQKTATVSQQEVKQDQAKEEETKQKKSDNKPNKDELLKNITVSLDYQDVSDKKRKVVLTVTNNTDYTFNGGVDVNFKDASGASAGYDALMDKKIAPNSNTKVILWGKENASDADYKVNGSFEEVKQDTQTKNDYNLVDTQQGNNFNTFFVVIPTIDKNNIVNIVKEFKNKYPKTSLSDGFEIEFYLPENEEDAKNHDGTNAKATYNINHNTNYERLIINDKEESITN